MKLWVDSVGEVLLIFSSQISNISSVLAFFSNISFLSVRMCVHIHTKHTLIQPLLHLLQGYEGFRGEECAVSLKFNKIKA